MRQLFLALFLIGCQTQEVKVSYTPSETVGCIGIIAVKDRLKCIGDLVRQLENIKNAKITVDSEVLRRIDSETVLTLETYGFVGEKEAKYLCFQTERETYDPTLPLS